MLRLKTEKLTVLFLPLFCTLEVREPIFQVECNGSASNLMTKVLSLPSGKYP